MTADRRLRIGGWAALLVAIAAPIEVAVAAIAADPDSSLNFSTLTMVEVVRFLFLLVAVIGLDPLFRSLGPDLAGPVRIIGVTAASVLIVADVASLAAIDLGTVGTVLTLVAGILAGVWFLGSGAILLRQGGDLARIGWTAQLGGLGNILTAIAVAIALTGPNGGGLTWLGWFRILGLFVMVYLVRVWSYVVRGRLPGPGIL